MKVSELIEVLSKVEGDRKVCFTYDSRVCAPTVNVVDTFEDEDGEKFVALRCEQEDEYLYQTNKPNDFEKNIVNIFSKFD